MERKYVRYLLAAVVCCCALSIAVAAEDTETVKGVEKQLQVKRNELKGLRLRNPAHILGEETQPTALRKRMPKAGDKKYYASQVVDVRPFCVCEHAALADGGTTARHSKSTLKRSMDRTSTDRSCSERELCPAWKQWRDAMKKVDETKQFNNDIDPVVNEIEALEKKLKDMIEAAAEARKAKQAAKGAK